MPEPELILRRLVESQFEFVLIGGLAAVVHGVTLVTRDADICCRFDAGNLFKLQSILADHHPVHRMTPQRLPLNLTPEFCERLHNLYLSTDLGTLDCLSEVAGLGGYDEVLAHSIQMQLWGGTARILSIDALILAKQAVNRAHDRLAVAQLQIIKAQQLQAGKGSASSGTD
jgi:hypothetical protein